MGRKRLLVLHTGGTLGMAPGEGALGASAAGALLEAVPESAQLGEIEVISPFLIDSADAGPAQWLAIAQAVAQHLDAFDGFVVVHGTDTMAYSATACSYLLSNLPKPVIFTGAQRPLASVRTDARRNLLGALELACEAVPEVGIFFDHQLHRGNRATKLSIEGFDAFRSPNFPALGEVGLRLSLRHDLLRQPQGLFACQGGFDARVVALRALPGMSATLWAPLLDGPALAFHVAGFGSGTLPAADPSWGAWIAEATEKGKLVVVGSQAPWGQVDLGLYATGAAAADAGALGCGDLTAEAATVKLMYLLDRFGGDTAKLRAHFHTSIAGESGAP